MEKLYPNLDSYTLGLPSPSESQQGWLGAAGLRHLGGAAARFRPSSPRVPPAPPLIASRWKGAIGAVMKLAAYTGEVLRGRAQAAIRSAGDFVSAPTGPHPDGVSAGKRGTQGMTQAVVCKPGAGSGPGLRPALCWPGYATLRTRQEVVCNPLFQFPSPRCTARAVRRGPLPCDAIYDIRITTKSYGSFRAEAHCWLALATAPPAPPHHS